MVGVITLKHTYSAKLIETVLRFPYFLFLFDIDLDAEVADNEVNTLWLYLSTFSGTLNFFWKVFNFTILLLHFQHKYWYFLLIFAKKYCYFKKLFWVHFRASAVYFFSRHGINVDYFNSSYFSISVYNFYSSSVSGYFCHLCSSPGKKLVMLFEPFFQKRKYTRFIVLSSAKTVKSVRERKKLQFLENGSLFLFFFLFLVLLQSLSHGVFIWIRRWMPFKHLYLCLRTPSSGNINISDKRSGSKIG